MDIKYDLLRKMYADDHQDNIWSFNWNQCGENPRRWQEWIKVCGLKYLWGSIGKTSLTNKSNVICPIHCCVQTCIVSIALRYCKAIWICFYHIFRPPNVLLMTIPILFVKKNSELNSNKDMFKNVQLLYSSVPIK